MNRHAIVSSMSGAALAVGLTLGPIATPIYAAGAAPAQSASISILDTGFNPTAVTIAAGGSVTWTNNGGNVHTASPAPGTGLNFDSGGLNPSQSFTFTFTTPASYNFSSAIDCLNGAGSTSFNCTGGVVNVVAAGASAPTAPTQSVAPASLPAVPVAQASANPQAPTVSVNDVGFTPATVTVNAGGMVMWTDTGQQVHSASATPGVGPIGPGVVFDTGGFAPGQTASLVFLSPGTYSYSSAPDCLNGNSNPLFGCAKPYTVVVTP
jgi:plastocyanin